MFELDIYDVVIALSLLMIVSYLFTIVSRKTRIPTVLMLLVLGMVIREASQQLGWFVEVPFELVRFLGVIGLILILLEAGLDLKLSNQKFKLMKRALASSLFVLILSVLGIGAAIYLLLDQSIYVSLVYAVPLSVISSTVVASSIHHLSEEKREFLTYESALSDVIGILLFDLLLASQVFSVGLVAFNILNIVVALVLSFVVSAVLIWLLTRVKVNIKAFLIFAVLLLLYAIGHKLQLPTLLAVLIFGLTINNWRFVRQVLRSHRLRQSLPEKQVTPVADTVKAVTEESAFFIRTFFFTLFGYSVGVDDLLDPIVILVGLVVVFVIFLVRYFYLRIFLKAHILPELFYAPRGLVTIVLFYSIPSSLAFDGVGVSVVFFTILVTTVVMFLGSLFLTPEDATRVSEERQWGLFHR